MRRRVRAECGNVGVYIRVEWELVVRGGCIKFLLSRFFSYRVGPRRWCSRPRLFFSRCRLMYARRSSRAESRDARETLPFACSVSLSFLGKMLRLSFQNLLCFMVEITRWAGRICLLRVTCCHWMEGFSEWLRRDWLQRRGFSGGTWSVGCLFFNFMEKSWCSIVVLI